MSNPIRPGFLKRLALSFDLVGYVQQFKPKKYGHELVIDCPQCFETEGKKEKLWVNTDKRTAICYFCNEGYSVLGLVGLLEDTTNKLKIIEVLRDHSRSSANGIRAEIDALIQQLSAAYQDTWKDEKLPAIALPDHFIPAFQQTKLPPYFKERGISMKRAIKYNLGWCDGGYYENRLIVPVLQHDRLVTVHSRYMEKTPPKGVKKVLYPKATKTSRMLFNYDVAKKQRRLVLCEDVFSAMAVGKSGVGTFGTSISKYQLALMLASAAEEIVIFWDLDALDKAYEEADRLSEYWPVRVVKLPDERDPDEHRRADLERMIERSGVRSGAGRFADRMRARIAAVGA